MRLVNFPVQRMRRPVARGSSVPAWPTFFVFTCGRSLRTTSKEVHSSGLSISSTCPCSKKWRVGSIGAKVILNREPRLYLEVFVDGLHGEVFGRREDRRDAHLVQLLYD